MARTEIITDDLDGSHDAQPVQFGWDGITWEIDLAEKNRKKLEDALKPFLDKAHPANVATAKTAEPRRRRAGGDGGKVDYGTIEYAGRPHRGRITDAEKEIVRNNFDEVNKRLSAAGLRMIDPADPKMKERYGL